MSYLLRAQDTKSHDDCQVFFSLGGKMEKREATIHIGIGGWEHEVLDRVLYDGPHQSTNAKLARYARTFDLVEVRSTFWDGSLGADDAAGWVQSVSQNPSFRFMVKLHREFTHNRTASAELRQRIRQILQTLDRAGNLGGLLMQFPFSFTNTSSNRFFLVKLTQLFGGFPLYLEVRHSSWNHPALRGLCEEHGVHRVSADLPRIRQFIPFSALGTSEQAYLRLHGRNERGWLLNGMDGRYDYLYNGRELIELRRRVEALIVSCKEIHIVFNNTTLGSAVVNALQLRSALLGGRALDVPPAALCAFPQLKPIALAAPFEQGLFSSPSYRTAV
jgi:uncharacterized protein YecE (DUF72 family)